MRKQTHRSFSYGYGGGRKRRFSPLALVGICVPLVLALIAGIVFVLPHIGSHAAAANGDCTLIVPANPLSAQGLATPYQLVATNQNKGPCNEANANQSAFVQAAVFDPNTSSISVYNPLVIDRGTTPAMAPVMPTLAANAVVAIWFGFNGDNLTLRGTNGSLQQGRCVNGIQGSIFGQFAYCNAPVFFRAANAAIAAGHLTPPQLGRAKDGLTCPTVRDFSVVDQDQSDNVTAAYLVNGNGQIAQMTAANQAALANAQVLTNGSDNGLLDSFIDPALGCTPWMAPDLANPGHMTTALPLDELQAAAHQAAPIALVPNFDPMVVVNGNLNLNKVNAYRLGVDQPPVQNAATSSTKTYCQNLLAVAPSRLQLDAHLTKFQRSPDPAAGNSLFTFLAQRFVFTYEANGLNCMKLLNQPDPITLKTDGNGVAIDATINGTTIVQPVNCSVNGNLLLGCSGTTTINGQTCSVTYDRNARQVNITCPAAQGQ
jgi:hypothetical protein